VSSQYIAGELENFDYVGAAASATVLLLISLVVIVSLDLLQRRAARRG
jgi:sulfate transport system permease protein